MGAEKMSDETQEPDWAKMEERLVGALSPLFLLRDVMIQRTASPSDLYYRIYLDSRHLGDPGYNQSGDLLKYKPEANALIERFERHPALAKRLAELRAMGFKPYFGVYDEPWVSMLTFFLPLDPKAEARLRQEAKSAAGIRTHSESQEFDRRLDLYVKQGWGPDWKKWRELFPLVQFP